MRQPAQTSTMTKSTSSHCFRVRRCSNALSRDCSEGPIACATGSAAAGCGAIPIRIFLYSFCLGGIITLVQVLKMPERQKKKTRAGARVRNLEGSRALMFDLGSKDLHS